MSLKTDLRIFDKDLRGILKRGNNVLVLGPPMSGKRALLIRFIYTGLKEGEAGIFVVTDHTVDEVRKIFRDFGLEVGEYEKEGLLIYVDLYSKTAGLRSDEHNYVRYVPNVGDITTLAVVLNDLISDVASKGRHLRLAFDNLTTLFLYNETKKVVRFLHVLFGKLRAVKAIGLFSLDTCIPHQDVLTIEGMVNGVLEIKKERGEVYVRFRSFSFSTDWARYDLLVD